MNIQYGFRDAVYVGKYDNSTSDFDYVAVFLVKENPFQELITAAKNTDSALTRAADVQSPIATIFGKSGGGDQTSFYDDSLLSTSSYPDNYVVSPLDYDTYYTPAARKAFLQTICTASVWDRYGIKEAVIEANPSLEYKTAKGISNFNDDTIFSYVYQANILSIPGTELLEALCNYALNVYGRASITESNTTHTFTYLCNDLGFNIILVPVKQSAVTIPSGVASLIDSCVDGDSDYKQTVGEIVSSAYSTVSCISTVFRDNFDNMFGQFSLFRYRYETPIFDITSYEYDTSLYFFDRTKGTIPESQVATENVTIQSISDFTSLVAEYETQDKVSAFQVTVNNDFSYFNPPGEYCKGRPDYYGTNCYKTISTFYTKICIIDSYEKHYCIDMFNPMKVGAYGSGSVQVKQGYTYDGITKLSSIDEYVFAAHRDDSTTFGGIHYSSEMSLWEQLGGGPHQSPDWTIATKFNNCIYYKATSVQGTTKNYIFTIGILSYDDLMMLIVPTDTSENDLEEFGAMLHLGVTVTRSVGPTIYVDDSVLGYVGTDAIPDVARYPSLSASNTFGNGFLYADLVIPPNKASVSQLNIYNKDSYSLSYIIAKNNLVVFFDPSDLFVYAKNASTSVSAKYECYACTRKAVVAGYNNKVYLESAVSTSGEIDIRAAASDTSEASNTQFAYTTLVGTPFTELSVNSMLINLLMYTGYVDHAFYDTELATLIDGVYTTVSSLIGQYYYVCICFPNTTDVCILKVDSQTSTVEGKTGYKVAICDSADVASLFVNGEAIAALNNSNAVCQFSNGNPVIHVDGYALVIDTNFTNGQSYFMFGLNSDSGDTSEFAIALSTKLTYNCNCKVPVLSVDSINTSILNVTDGIVTFTINNVPVTLNSNTGVLYYSDDVFELDCSIDEVSGIFEYMKYCTISSVFYGVYKVTSADSALYTVTSDGVILNDLDFSVEEIDE